METKERIKKYAKQIGVDTVGGFKNSSATKRLSSRLTPAQQRRIRKKQSSQAANV
jgi:hypothetical protein